MSSSSSDASGPPVSRRAGLLGRVWGAVTRRNAAEAGSERIAAIWGIGPNGIQTHDPAERIAVPAPTPESSGISEPTNDAPAPPVVQETSIKVAVTRLVLEVPFADKEQAKALGARWDRTARAWYAPAEIDHAPFEAWLPGKAQPADPVAQFAEALRRAGLQVKRPEMDGKLHRVAVDGDCGREKSGAYVGYLDGWPAGFIQNFKGERLNWSMPGRPSRGGAAVGPEIIKEREARKAMEQEQRAREYKAASDLALSLWNTATTTQELHPYLARKGVNSGGLRIGAPGQVIEVADGKGPDGQERVRAMSVAGWLIVPVETAEGSLSSLQFISPRQSGHKIFLCGGKMQGGHHVIGQVGRGAEPILICEGVATGKTLHALADMPVVVAFNAGNLREVAQAYRAQFPDRAIYIAGDNDHRREAEGKPNVGREKAEEAAAAIGGQALIPSFSSGADGSDWNDVARIEGREAAQLALVAAIRIAEREQMVAGMGAARLSEWNLDRESAKGREHADAELER